MRTCTITCTDNAKGGVDIVAENHGYNGFELIALLELKKQDIIDQLNRSVKFTRTVHRENGDIVKIEDK